MDEDIVKNNVMDAKKRSQGCAGIHPSVSIRLQCSARPVNRSRDGRGAGARSFVLSLLGSKPFGWLPLTPVRTVCISLLACPAVMHGRGKRKNIVGKVGLRGLALCVVCKSCRTCDCEKSYSWRVDVASARQSTAQDSWITAVSHCIETPRELPGAHQQTPQTHTEPIIKHPS